MIIWEFFCNGIHFAYWEARSSDPHHHFITALVRTPWLVTSWTCIPPKWLMKTSDFWRPSTFILSQKKGTGSRPPCLSSHTSTLQSSKTLGQPLSTLRQDSSRWFFSLKLNSTRDLLTQILGKYVQWKIDLADTSLAENLSLEDTLQKIWAIVFDF